MHLETKARILREHPSPSESELRRHAQERDDYVDLGRRLGYQVGDYCAVSALPGPAAWYPERYRRERR